MTPDSVVLIDRIATGIIATGEMTAISPTEWARSGPIRIGTGDRGPRGVGDLRLTGMDVDEFLALPLVARLAANGKHGPHLPVVLVLEPLRPVPATLVAHQQGRVVGVLRLARRRGTGERGRRR